MFMELRVFLTASVLAVFGVGVTATVGVLAAITVIVGVSTSAPGAGEHPLTISATSRTETTSLFTGNPRPFNRFNKPLLQDKIHQQQRQNIQEGTAEFDGLIQAVKNIDGARRIQILVRLDEL